MLDERFYQELGDTLSEAFPDSYDLDRITRLAFAKKLTDISSNNQSIPILTQSITDFAKSRDLVNNLIYQARQRNETNIRLGKIENTYKKGCPRFDYILGFKNNDNYIQEPRYNQIINDLKKLLQDCTLEFINSRQSENNLILEVKGSDVAFSKLIELCNNNEESRKSFNYNIDFIKDRKYGITRYRRTQAVQYILVISSAVKERDITENLANLINDPSLTLKKKELGGKKLFFEGSEEGFEKLNKLLNSGQLTEILGFSIEELNLIEGNQDIISIWKNKTTDIPVNISSVEMLLTNEKWKEADTKTSQLLLLAAKQEDGLATRDIKKIDCKLLLEINDLWEDASSYFGFKIQQNIWNEVWEDYKPNRQKAKEEFGKKVNWYVEQKKGQGKWISKLEIKPKRAIDEEIKGYLPTPPPSRGNKNDINVWAIEAIAERLAKCEQKELANE